VTHDQVEAMTMGDAHRRHEGRPHPAGRRAARGLRPPANVFVAGFLRTPPMNLFRAQRVAGRARACASDGLAIPLPPSVAARAASKAGAEVVARHPARAPGESRADAAGAAPIPAVVEFVEQLGDEGIVHARARRARLLGKLDAHAAPRAGDRIALRFDPSRLHLFDAATERRLPD
jgi:ABC-type sugar transport system ATPase subunit